MDTVENVSPTGTAITIKFMVMVMAAINSGSLWRDFPKTINTRHKPSLRSTYLESTILPPSTPDANATRLANTSVGKQPRWIAAVDVASCRA
jgi:hypothetical protein